MQQPSDFTLNEYIEEREQVLRWGNLKEFKKFYKKYYELGIFEKKLPWDNVSATKVMMRMIWYFPGPLWQRMWARKWLRQNGFALDNVYHGW